MTRTRLSLAAAALVATFAFAAPAFAGEFEDQVSLCAAALDAQGVAKSTDYRARFVKSRGGAVKTVVIKLLPLASGESQLAECKIKRGEVTAAEIQPQS